MLFQVGGGHKDFSGAATDRGVYVGLRGAGVLPAQWRGFAGANCLSHFCSGAVAQPGDPTH